MVQYRKLDPLANAGPHQRLMKMPVKSFTITEEQFEALQARRPELISIDSEHGVAGNPVQDLLEIHYAFATPQLFHDDFPALFEACVSKSSKDEAPRGIVISFRDRPNRAIADTIFWGLALDEAENWVEMDWVAVPEQPEPGIAVADRYMVREAAEKDREVITALEAAATGEQPLSAAGLDSLFASTRWLRVVTDADGNVVGYLALNRLPGGWGVIDRIAVKPELTGALAEPLLRWAVAWLRNNGGRRLRKRVMLSGSDDIALLRSLGFTAAESGVDFRRAVDLKEVESKLEERKSHGIMLRMGDWR